MSRTCIGDESDVVDLLDSFITCCVEQLMRDAVAASAAAGEVVLQRVRCQPVCRSVIARRPVVVWCCPFVNRLGLVHCGMMMFLLMSFVSELKLIFRMWE